MSIIKERLRNFNKFLSNKKYLLGFVVLTGILIVLVGSSLAVTVPVKFVEIKSVNLSYDASKQGAWKVRKSAFWLSKDKARITYEINSNQINSNKNRDIILAIDSSIYMGNENFDLVKQNIITSATNFLGDNGNSRIALISFNNTATLLSDFTNDLGSLTNYINGILTTSGSNYYNAFLKVQNMLEKYTYDDSRDISVVLVMSSFPTLSTPNELSEYNYLKQKYPYLDVRAIQYNMSEDILDITSKISDRQYIANDSSSLLEALNHSFYGSLNYDYFKVEDTINSNYFNINKVIGNNVMVDNNKIVWNSNNYDSGSKESFSVDISLKSNLGTTSLFETNTTGRITSKINGVEENVTSTLSPVLSNTYKVTYYGNAPIGCNVSNVPSSSSQFVYDNVSISNNIPVCAGYQFKGWKIVTSDVKKNNDSNFIMPEKDVTIKATWSKLGLNKLSDGTVSESISLYKVLENEAKSGGLAKEYTGNHQDSMAGVGTEKIYHYYASTDDEGNEVQNKNNVIFAGFCWQMLRTTDTGGVKMIYNGEPDDNGKCGADRGDHYGYYYFSPEDGAVTTSKSYYYATDFEYNKTTGQFDLTGDIIKATWSNSNYKNLLGKYSCQLVENTTSCTSLYYIYSYYSSTQARILRFQKSEAYSNAGSSFYNLNSDFITHLGYMYDASTYTHLKTSSTSTYKFGSRFTYRNGQYTLSGATKTWSLSEYDRDMIDIDLGNTRYTCLNTSGSCTNLMFVFSTWGETKNNVTTQYLHYIMLKNGKGVAEALEEMLSTNKDDSMVKKIVDLWYAKFMLNYTSYLEDTIFCGDRSYTDAGTWNPAGGSFDKHTQFTASKDDLSCSRETDKFSVSNEKAKLTYPAALASLAEISLLGNNNAKKSAEEYYLITPSKVWYGVTNMNISIKKTGEFNEHSPTITSAIRPVVSLKPGTKYVSGIGTMNSPYIVDLDIN